MINRAKEKLMDFLFPTRGTCLNCGDPSGLEREWLCERCRTRLRPRLHSVRSDEWPENGISRAWFMLYYEPPAAKLIRQFKYNGVYRLAPYLAQCLEPLGVVISPKEFDVIVPVPLYSGRLRDRGFNQAEILAKCISEKSGIPISLALRRVRRTRQQAKLSPEKRKSNLQNAFAINGSFKGRRVLVVDDVLTTGSTVNSCAQALREAGAADVQAAVLAGSRYYRHHAYHIYRRTRQNSVKNVNPE